MTSAYGSTFIKRSKKEIQEGPQAPASLGDGVPWDIKTLPETSRHLSESKGHWNFYTYEKSCANKTSRGGLPKAPPASLELTRAAKNLQRCENGVMKFSYQVWCDDVLDARTARSTRMGDKPCRRQLIPSTHAPGGASVEHHKSVL